MKGDTIYEISRMPGHRTRDTIQIHVCEIVFAEQGLSSDGSGLRVEFAWHSKSVAIISECPKLIDAD